VAPLHQNYRYCWSRCNRQRSIHARSLARLRCQRKFRRCRRGCTRRFWFFQSSAAISAANPTRPGPSSPPLSPATPGITQNYAMGAALTVSVQTADAGCAKAASPATTKPQFARIGRFLPSPKTSLSSGWRTTRPIADSTLPGARAPAPAGARKEIHQDARPAPLPIACVLLPRSV